MNAHNAERLAIWNCLTPEQRDADRFINGQIPYGATRAPETDAGRQWKAEAVERGKTECTCHINPPCKWCTSLTQEEADLLDREGPAAIRAVTP
jgi:hypothetical protein